MEEDSGGRTGQGTERASLRATGLLGGASVLTTIVGIARTKTFALIVGPAGVGLIGIYTGIIGTIESVVGLGLTQSGIRAIAEASGGEDPEGVSRVTSFLQRANLVLGVLGGSVLFLWRREIAVASFGGDQRASAIGILAIGLGFSICTGSQMAYLIGLRRTKALVIVNVTAAMINAVVGIVAVRSLGERGVLLAVLATPVSLFGIASVVAGRQGWRVLRPAGFRNDTRLFVELARLGFALVAIGFVAAGSVLAARLIVLKTGGVVEAGLFHAAWGLAAMCFGFVTGAIGTDFYPRLAKVCRNPAEARGAIRAQMDQTLLIMAPMALGLFVFGPSVLDIFYSATFRDAWPVVRLLLLGHLIKASYLPMAFLFMAEGAATMSVLMEVVWSALFLGTMVVLVPSMGLVAVGVSFVVASSAYLVIVTIAVARRVGQPWTRKLILRAGGPIGMLALLIGLPRQASGFGRIVGGTAVLLLGFDLLRRVGPAVWRGWRLPEGPR